MVEATIGFLGAGKMGEALARGLLEAAVVPRERLFLSDTDPARRTTVAEALGVQVVEDNRQVVEAADVVVVALKPDVVRSVLPTLAEVFTPQKLVVSIAAGVTLAELERMVGREKRLVRVMPNTPALVGAGASAYALGHNATEADASVVEELLGAVGLCVQVPERLLDAVTGLSGSGPAFVAVFIEALADGGVLCGLPRDQALQLAAQTVLGTARLILEGGKRPAEIKDMVASPGGTTIEGIRALEELGLRAAAIAAVEAAAAKSAELGER